MRWSGVRGVVVASGLALAAAGLAPGARADECKSCGPQHRARFQVESTRDVENDWITALVGVTAEDANPAALADRVNKDMAWALEQAKAESKVKAKSGGYSTYPINEKGRIVRWQANQQLVLEGSDAAAMTALLGKLQARVQLQSFEFSVSDATRRKVQEELVTEALAAFRARAALVAKGLGASSYALDDVSVETASPGYPVPMMRDKMAMAASEMATPPAVEAGTSRVAVTVQGSVVLD
ncbi:MAG TPA: SIMPL domain-containing protein [Myxococcota bacterium]|nr:SIMPL domain-containing protein [Myxococcota bacterium]